MNHDGLYQYTLCMSIESFFVIIDKKEKEKGPESIRKGWTQVPTGYGHRIRRSQCRLLRRWC